MRRVQASSDAAPARAVVAGRPLRVMRAHVPGPGEVAGESPQAGEVAVAQCRLFIGCADGPLELLEVKPDGKRAMAAAEFAAGIHSDDAHWEAI